MNNKKITNASKVLFGQMLVNDNIITQAQLEEGINIQNKQKVEDSSNVQRIGVILIGLGYIDKVILEDYLDRIMLTFIEKKV